MSSLLKTIPHPATLIGLGALVLLTARPAAAQTAHLTLQSQPGDYIGQGQNYDLTFKPTTPGDQISASVLPPKTGTQPDFVRFFLTKDDGATPHPFLFGGLDFSTQGLNIALTPGTYTDAQRASFAAPGHPGLDVDMDGRGSNTLTGSFTVTNFTYSKVVSPFSTSYVINTFDASFEQHSEGKTPALFGQFSYRGANAAPVPEASTTASLGLLLSLGAGGLIIAAKRKKPVR